ncbi:MAG: MgtC/SapB family protein [Roseicyclus sp.]|nr:MgtC/SapB family protein [Roseicyclus sp.]
MVWSSGLSEETRPVAQILSDLNLSLLFSTINMAFAVVLGAIIGSERQFRGRMAGLRTNALVSLGAAGFVTFAALFPEDINPTRVAAQVVSGIGFLGAGIIFRDGFNIQGINTAATLWCSAAVGLISGTGHIPYAIALTALIVFSNLGLRPVVRKLKKAASKNAETEQLFDVSVDCLREDEKDMRAALIGSLGEQGLSLCQIASRTDNTTVEIIAQVRAADEAAERIERVLTQMSLVPRLLRATWSAAEDGEITFKT